MAKERNDNRGFSLVELMIVLVVIGILAGITAPALHRYLESYRVADAGNLASSEIRLARQKAVSNSSLNWFWVSTGTSTYWTGNQTRLANGGWSGTTWTQWSLPSNTKFASINFGGGNWVMYTPDGIPRQSAGGPAISGLMRITSTTGIVTDTSSVNLDLTGGVWR